MAADTIPEEQFRAEALAFLEANAKPRQEETTAWGEGSDQVGLLAEKTFEEELAEVREAKEWKGRVFDAGFGWSTGRSRYGGRELPASYERTWQAESARFDTPSEQAFGIGLGMVAPTILAHATDKVKDAYLRKMYRGDIVGCQLFSEPAAGSDLAGLQGRAVRDGDEWVLNGQKVWTSGAQYSDIDKPNADGRGPTDPPEQQTPRKGPAGPGAEAAASPWRSLTNSPPRLPPLLPAPRGRACDTPRGGGRKPGGS